MSLRDLFVGISLQDNATNDLNRIDLLINNISAGFNSLTSSISGVSNGLNTVNNNAGNAADQVNDLSSEIEDATNEMDDLVDESEDLPDTLDDAADEMNDLTGEIGDAADEMQDLENQTNDVANATSNANKQAGFFGTTLGKVAGILASAFAIDKIKDFGISLIEEAAEAQAITAQFEQVFGDVQGGAQTMVNDLGKSFGMVPERIKPAFTQMTSMFKGLGLSTEDAMGQAETAVTLAADAAAFYDKSYEDANASLNSFIKGNYEGGESIGLFANETQLAAWASKNLKLDWKKLGEADKQMARLKFAESMQEAAGATGQAARESEEYQNQLGNLQQTWANVKAKLGEPILGPAIKGLQTLAEWLGNIDTDQIINGFKTFGGYMSDTFSPVLNDTKTIAGGLWDAFEDSGGLDTAKGLLEDFKGGLAWIKDNSGVITAGLLGLVGGLAAFKIISGINAAIGIFNTLMIAFRTGTVMATVAQWGLNTALLANPLTWVAVAIGAVIAIGVLLWKNWDTVKLKAGQLWDKTKEVFGGIYDWGMQKIQPVINFFKGLADKFNDFKSAITNFKLPGWVTTIGNTLSGAASKVKGWLSPDGSHATGLASVPFDGYTAELHKDEAVLTADQSNALRDAGILKSNADGTPTVDMNSGSPSVSGSSGVGSPVFHITIHAASEKAIDIKQAVKQGINEAFDSFGRTNPQVTIR